VLGAVALACLAAPVGRAAASCIREGRPAMGTILQLELCGENPEALRSLAQTAFAEVDREEAIFSSFRPDSDVERLRRRAGEGAVPIPPDLERMLGEAQRWSAATRGTFDVTVGPLVALWRTADHVPSPRTIEEARSRTGFDKISLGADGTAALARRGMAIDLGGIAKGYALDRVRDRLRDSAAGLDSALLEFGSSSVWAIGAPPDGSSWNLVLRSPDGEPLALLALRDQALSVSASFGSSREIDGRRYGHVIDPRSGRALERELVGAVIAESATAAEALSKSVLVLAEEGIASVESMHAAQAILFEPGKPPLRTSGWERAVAPAGASAPRG
jgi:FAD:protein FMN transferase